MANVRLKDPYTGEEYGGEGIEEGVGGGVGEGSTEVIAGPTFTPPPAAPPSHVQFPTGNYTNSQRILDAPPGDPRYNAAQKEFEGQTDWGGLEQELRAAASELGIEFDPSDLAGIQRNAGYDAAHLGSGSEYGERIQQFKNNALQNYAQRATNTPGPQPGAKLRSPSTASSGGGGAPSGGGNAQGSRGDFRGLMEENIRGLLDGGQFNQDIVNRRMDSARGDLNRFRTSQQATDRSQLANRGLLSEGAGHESGPEYSSLRMLDENVADRFADTASGIYANESENADARMMQALQLGVGMTAEDARLAVDQFRAETERTGVGNQFTLGLGNLALGNSVAANNYNLGLGDFGLRRDAQLNTQDSAQLDRLIRLIEQLTQNGGNVNGGFN